ncbi:hypothetical protein [Rickettsiella endosymbiont of Miltochrista miniata]|uniref:hypothetical protein n=1 Tax=Rickettsiella endosymbiont of Miltochrista miniata TaxID=3066239 RepID=UPI00313D9835
MLSLTDNDYKKELYCAIDYKFYWLISPVADGNCGLYAFACGLIDAITRDQLTLDKHLFEDFRKKVLKNLVSCPLKKLLKNPSFNFSQFKVFLHQHPSRQGLISLTALLSNSLRKIGYEGYLELLSQETQLTDLETEDKKLNQDGNYVGFEILIALANYFKVEINLIAYNPNLKSYYWAQTPLDKSKSLFTLLNISSHWHYLLPKDQTNGLAFLPEEIDPPQPSKPLLENANKQLKKNIARLPTIVKMLTQELIKTFHLNENFNSDQEKLINVDENLYLKSKSSSCMPWFFGRPTPEIPDILSTTSKVYNR